MKYCKDKAALLSGYVDGTLNRSEELRLREHLAVCPGCKACLKDQLAIHKSFPDFEDIQVPEGFTASVMNAVRADIARQSSGASAPPEVPTPAQTLPKKPKRQVWKAVVPAVACLAVVVILGSQGLLFHSSMSNAPTEGAPTAASTGEPASATAEDSAAAQNGPPESTATPYGVMNDAADAGAENSAESGTAAATNGRSTNGPVVENPESMQSEYGASGVNSAWDGAATYFAKITLTAQEAGDLLDALTPAFEEDHQRSYELTREEYGQLTAALTERGYSLLAEETGQESDLALVTVVDEA